MYTILYVNFSCNGHDYQFKCVSIPFGNSNIKIYATLGYLTEDLSHLQPALTIQQCLQLSAAMLAWSSSDTEMAFNVRLDLDRFQDSSPRKKKNFVEIFFLFKNSFLKWVLKM